MHPLGKHSLVNSWKKIKGNLFNAINLFRQFLLEASNDSSSLSEKERRNLKMALEGYSTEIIAEDDADAMGMEQDDFDAPFYSALQDSAIKRKVSGQYASISTPPKRFQA